MTQTTDKRTAAGPAPASARSGLVARSDLVVVAARLVVGGVLVAAGASKIAEPTAFARIIDGYELLPAGWSSGLAVSLPWVEVLVGCCLIVGLWTRSAALVAAGMFAVFAGAMAVNVVRGAELSCGCFGGSAGALPLWASWLRTSALLGGAVVVLRQGAVPIWSVDGLLEAEAKAAPGTDPLDEGPSGARRAGTPVAAGDRP